MRDSLWFVQGAYMNYYYFLFFGRESISIIPPPERDQLGNSQGYESSEDQVLFDSTCVTNAPLNWPMPRVTYRHGSFDPIGRSTSTFRMTTISMKTHSWRLRGFRCEISAHHTTLPNLGCWLPYHIPKSWVLTSRILLPLTPSHSY